MQAKWHRIEFDLVRSRVGPRRPLLDVGCGPGTFLGTFPDGEEVLGLDVAAPQVEFARREYGTGSRRFEVFGGGDLPVADNAFAAVSMIEVVEHLTDPSGPLEEVFRVLRPGGRIVATTPNYASHWPVLEWLVGKLSPVDYAHQHVTHFTKPSLAAALSAAGFVNVEVTSFMRLAPFCAALSWGFADLVLDLERRLPILPGALLIGVGDKPAGASSCTNDHG